MRHCLGAGSSHAGSSPSLLYGCSSAAMYLRGEAGWAGGRRAAAAAAAVLAPGQPCCLPPPPHLCRGA